MFPDSTPFQLGLVEEVGQGGDSKLEVTGLRAPLGTGLPHCLHNNEDNSDDGDNENDLGASGSNSVPRICICFSYC